MENKKTLIGIDNKNILTILSDFYTKYKDETKSPKLLMNINDQDFCIEKINSFVVTAIEYSADSKFIKRLASHSMPNDRYIESVAHDAEFLKKLFIGDVIQVMASYKKSDQ